jgi:hypothetical protein
MTLGDQANERLERLSPGSKNPADYVVVGSVYGGPTHIVRDAEPAVWQEKWMHTALCGAGTPRGGWQPPSGQVDCPLCRFEARRLGMDPYAIEARA